MIKYIAYCRKSTDEKEKQVLSIEAQIEELKQFAQKEKLEIVEFITESKTAKIPGRKEFQEVLEKIERGKANAILSWHPDRLARNSIDGGKIIYLLDNGKLKDLKFPIFWFENTPQGKFFLSIAFGQSKYYVDNLSENVKRGLRQKLRRGEWPSKAPLGYLNEPKLRTIVIDPESSEIIKKAFRLFAQGNKSLTEISRYLFKNGFTAKSNKPLKVDSVKNMLSNKFYTGLMIYGGEFYRGSHQPLISKKLFEKVQKQIEKISRPRKQGHNFPFTGLITCGECRAAITAEAHTKFYPSTRGRVDYIYYRCTKKIKPCSQEYIREEELKSQLRKIVAKVGLHPGWRKYFEKWMKKDQTKDEKKVKGQIENFRTETKAIDKKLNRLLNAYLDQVIDSKIYKEKKNELFEKKLRLEEKILKIQRHGSSWLEPMKEFLESALLAHKIARAKNKSHLLRQMAKKVGSNYSLYNRRLSARLKFEFRALAAGGGAASAPPSSANFSFLVSVREFESACGVVRDYVETGGKKIEGGTGLAKV